MGVETIDRITESVDRGHAFVANTGKKTLSGGADLLYFLVGTGKKVTVTRIIFGVDSGKGVLYISTSPTGTITGTDLAKLNRYVGKGQTSTATVKGDVGGVASKGDTEYVIPFASAFVLELPSGLKLVAGTKMLFGLDLTGTSVNLAVGIEWSEDDA